MNWNVKDSEQEILKHLSEREKAQYEKSKAEKEESTIDIEGNKIKVGVNSAVFQYAKTMIPLGRPGTPQEAAGAIYMFCIPESNYVTGQILMCHGGGFGL